MHGILSVILKKNIIKQNYLRTRKIYFIIIADIFHHFFLEDF